MIIKTKETEEHNLSLLLHAVSFSLNFPAFEATVIGQKKIVDVLGDDADLLASRIVSHLNNRQSIKSVTIKSNYAQVQFTAITPDSIFGQELGSAPSDRIVVDYNVSAVNKDTGYEGKPKKFSVSEQGWDNKNVAIEVTYAANYYRSRYLLKVAEGMKSKNPGGYLTLKKNSESIGGLPYVISNLCDQAIGHVTDGGFIFTNVYPIPGSVISTISVSDYPHLSASFGIDRVESRVRSLIINHHEVDLTELITDVRNNDVGTISSGVKQLYLINLSGSTISMSERLMGHLLLKRQNLVWCFSELSRFFELNSIINDSTINRNLRVFQDRLKRLVNNEVDYSLFPDQSPRDLEDLLLQLFPIEYKSIYKVIKQIDPNRILYKLEFKSGNKSEFNRFSTGMKYLSPGLLLSISFLRSEYKVIGDEEIVIDGLTVKSLIIQSSDFQFSLVPLSSHTADSISFSEYSKLLDSVVLQEYISLINIIFWLNIEDSSDYLINRELPGVVRVKTNTHLARKYSQLPLFEGNLSAKVLDGLF